MATASPSDLDPTFAPSVFDIDALQIARVYAQALLRNAESAKKVDLIQEHFDGLVGKEPKHDSPSDIANLITSNLIPKDRKEQIIREAFAGKVDDLFLDFLLVLNKHDRLDLLRPAGAMYRELRDELLKRVRFQVRSAVPLTADQKEQITRTARETFKTEPVLVEVIDPDLIGGLQIQIGDRLIDLSVKSRLQAIRNQLIERSSHEIQSRRNRIGS